MRIPVVLVGYLACSFLIAGASLSGCKSSGKIFRNHWNSNSPARPAEMERAGSGSASGNIDDGVLSPSDHVLGPHASVSPVYQPGPTQNAMSNPTSLADNAAHQTAAPEAVASSRSSEDSNNTTASKSLAATSMIAAQTIAYPVTQPAPAQLSTPARAPTPTQAIAVQPSTTPAPQTVAPAGVPTTTQTRAQPTLQLEIRGVRAGRGDLKLAVFDSEESFPTPANAAKTWNLKADEANVQQGTMVMSIPADRPIAVAVFQDIDGDGQLGRNRLGIPTEPFAFSNNAMGRRGPPDFAAALVQPPPNPQMPWRTIIQLP